MSHLISDGVVDISIGYEVISPADVDVNLNTGIIDISDDGIPVSFGDFSLAFGNGFDKS